MARLRQFDRAPRQARLIPLLIQLGLPISLGMLGGCETAPSRVPGPVRPADSHNYTILDGHSGNRLTWAEFTEMVLAADVVLLGENHDDPGAHTLEQEVVSLVMQAKPGSAVSLEMLERDEQITVDSWLRGEIPTEELVESTGSASWAGEGSWKYWYQPMLDSARMHGGAVVAANAPRPLVRQVRGGGLASTALLEEPDRGFIEIPSAALINRPYYDRFVEIMGVRESSDSSAVDAVFRSQTSWDATMADSIANARAGGAPAVVHAVGAFHIRFEGGTVSELRMRRPQDRVLVVITEPSASGTLAPEDFGVGDVLVHTPPY